MFVLCSQSLLQLQMEIQCSPKVRILQRQNSQTLWYLVKKPSEAGRSDCSFNKFFIRKYSGYSISIFTNVCFACQEINIADHYR